MTGTDSIESARVVAGELTRLPHVPELPNRGPWASSVARTGAMLIDLYPELDVERWRISLRDGRDARRARSMLAQDLDAVEAVWQGYAGAAKTQVCGPLTMAGTLELRSGEVMASDPAALRDLAASLVEGVVRHLSDLANRVPGATWWVQIDEPLLSQVTGGRLTRPSGWGTVPAMPTTEAAALLQSTVDAVRRQGAEVVVGCGDDGLDWDVVGRLSADAIRVDLVDLVELGDLGEPGDLGDLGGLGAVSTWGPALEEWWSRGGGLWLGVDSEDSKDAEAAVSGLHQVRSVLGVTAEVFADGVVLTPTRAAGPVGAGAYAALKALMIRLHDSL